MPDGELRWDGREEPTALERHREQLQASLAKPGGMPGRRLLSRRVPSTEGSPATLSAKRLN